jgi:uncharacterized membrane protein
MSNANHTLHAALAAVMALGFTAAASASAHEATASTGKEKCYGTVKAGKNSCANLTGSHACAGLSTKDKDITEWTLVAKGTCTKLGGLSADEAKAALAKQSPAAKS